MQEQKSPSELYNSILDKLREEGYSDEDVKIVAEYLTGRPTEEKDDE